MASKFDVADPYQRTEQTAVCGFEVRHLVGQAAFMPPGTHDYTTRCGARVDFKTLRLGEPMTINCPDCLTWYAAMRLMISKD